IIPKKVLREKKILKDEEITGKMALRFYPSWETSLNKTAQATQKWQCDYFIDTTDNFQNETLEQLYFSSSYTNNKKP
ncbi:MepB family protein, partial [Lactococcus garvieae]